MIATDDAQFTAPDHFGGGVMVKARENDPDALLAALKARQFYSSQGPELRRVEAVGKTVGVACSVASSVILPGQGNAAIACHGASMARASQPLDRLDGSRWWRVVVVDAVGRRAWSNPVLRSGTRP